MEGGPAVMQRRDVCVCRRNGQVTVALGRGVSDSMRPVLDVGMKMTRVGGAASEERGVSMRER